MDLRHRQIAVDAVMDRFNRQAFAWGQRDCVRMAAYLAKKRGHRVSLAKSGSYSTPAGAQKALKRAGFDTVEAALDARFARIAPAEAVIGDLIALPSDQPFPALAVVLGNGGVLCTYKGEFIVKKALKFDAAWRVHAEG